MELPLKRKQAENDTRLTADSVDEVEIETGRARRSKLSESGRQNKRPVNKVGKKRAIEKDDSSSTSRQPFNIPQYRFTPVIPDPRGVMLSPWDRAPQLRLADNNLSVSGFKGYRLIRATHGVNEGSWYFEVTIREDFQQDKLDEKFCKVPGSSRIGWARASAYMQGPVGYDRYGFSICCRTGAIVHERKPKPYIKPNPILSTFREETQPENPEIKVGDVVGFYINLPPKGQTGEGSSSQTQFELPVDKKDSDRQQVDSQVTSTTDGPILNWNTDRHKLVWRDSQIEYFLDEDKDTGFKILPGSSIRFSVNGHDYGVAFANIPAGTYYPTASLYMGGHVTFNFGPNLKFPPLMGSDTATKPISELASIPDKLTSEQVQMENHAGHSLPA